jgi:hypothetical protein
MIQCAKFHPRKQSVVEDRAFGVFLVVKFPFETFRNLAVQQFRGAVKGAQMHLHNRFEPVRPNGELDRKGALLVFKGGFSEPVTSRKVRELLDEDRTRGMLNHAVSSAIASRAWDEG